MISNNSMSENENDRKEDDSDAKSFNYSDCYFKNIAIIVLVILTIILMIIIEVFRLYAINHNLYFDGIYFYIYLALFILLLIALDLII